MTATPNPAAAVRIAFSFGMGEAIQVALCDEIVSLGEALGNMRAFPGMTLGDRAGIRSTVRRINTFAALLDQLDGDREEERILLADEATLFDLANRLHRYGSGAVDGWDEDTPAARAAIDCGEKCLSAARIIAAELATTQRIERDFLIACVASPEDGAEILQELNIDEVFASPIARRAATHLRNHLAEPLEGLADEADSELATYVTETVARASVMTSVSISDIERAVARLLEAYRPRAAAS